MGFQADVLDTEEEGDVKIDVGGGDSAVADGFAPSGDDAPPLPGDTAAGVEGVESGTRQITGYHDNETTAIAKPGEKRIYARSVPGVLAVEIYLQKDGSLLIKDHLGGGEVTIAAGEVEATGEVTAVAGPTQNTLTGHMTASPFGPLATIPGT